MLRELSIQIRARHDGLQMLVVGCLLFIGLGVLQEITNPLAMTDFQETWNGARCLVLNLDPYQPDQMWSVYMQQAPHLPADPAVAHTLHLIVSLSTNLPTTLLLVAPLALLPWKLAMVLWMAILSVCFVLACCCIWKVNAAIAPRFSGALIFLLAVNSGLLLATGNMAALSVGLAAIAVCCFIRDRFVPLGIFLLAVSLFIKPHDAGPIWLYFLLAGGVQRKRALQTLVLTVVMAAPAALWLYHVAPHWPQEYHANILTAMSPGGRDYPGPNTAGGRGMGMIVSLQAALSLLRDDPGFYNPIAYLICGALILVWCVKTWRVGYSSRLAWFALASISALALLPVYHRTYDARLLLLTIPAAAMLWRQRGWLGWTALWLTIAAFVLTGDLFWIVLFQATHYSGLSVTLAMIPAPLILLALGVFYLWVYLRSGTTPPDLQPDEG
ncbi:MAG: hypothetical protein WAL45_10985 [Terracidiphilus sp.]